MYAVGGVCKRVMGTKASETELRRAGGEPVDAHAAKAAGYERTVTTRYPLELGLAVRVPLKKERRRQRPIAGGLHESRATPSEPVRRFTRLEKTQPSSGRKRSM
jgi:hypothetical protein